MHIACLCPTWGRPHLLPNSLACFLAQNHPHKRLLILDDGDQVTPQQGHNWQVWSTATRYPDLPSKYAALIAHAGDWPDAYAVWDDDDIYFPHHLSAAAQLLPSHPWTHPTHVLSDGSGRLEMERTGGNLHGSIVIRRDALETLGGWLQTPRADFDLQQIGRLTALGAPGRPEPCPSYMFRWASTGARHYQNYVRSPADTTTCARNVMSSTAKLPVLTPRFDAHTTAILARYGSFQPPTPLT